jgi:hypothetical protein
MHLGTVRCLPQTEPGFPRAEIHGLVALPTPAFEQGPLRANQPPSQAPKERSNRPSLSGLASWMLIFLNNISV